MFISTGPYQVSLLCWVIVCAIVAFLAKVPNMHYNFFHVPRFIFLSKHLLLHFSLQIIYYTLMHLWKDSIASRLEVRRSRFGNGRKCCKVVHHSESWLMGETVTTAITFIILPTWVCYLVEKKREKEEKEEKYPGYEEERDWKILWRALIFAIPVLLFILPLALLFALVVLAFIAVSIGKDIKMMIGRPSKWMKGKLCNSTSASTPQVR
jgi:hypothetical protein